MFCPKCGTENPDEAAFCGYCGNRLAPAAIAPAPEAVAPAPQPAPTPPVSPPTPSVARAAPQAAPPAPPASVWQTSRPAAETAAGRVDEVSTAANVGVIVASLFFPVIGLIIGPMYMMNASPVKKKAGRRWLLVAVGAGIVWLLYLVGQSSYYY
jgi:hypothetical protein